MEKETGPYFTPSPGLFKKKKVLFAALSVFFIISIASAYMTGDVLHAGLAESEEAPGAEHKEARYWAEVFRSINPALSAGEFYEIGRAVVRYGSHHGLTPELILAVIKVESNGNLRAVSPRGAVGLMQVMPWWLKELKMDGDLFSIDTNIRVGCYILSENIKRWGEKEGILRYYRGTLTTDERYFIKVQKAMSSLKG